MSGSEKTKYEPLKNLYSKEFVLGIGKALLSVSKGFDLDAFEKSVFDKEWKHKELKERTRHLALTMGEYIHGSYPDQIATLKKIAPKFSGYPAVVFPDFVEVFGLEDFDVSIDALMHFTTYSTSEFAIRPFIQNYPETIHLMLEWTKHENHHVRRLASEGCRPLLPWGGKLHEFVKDPAPIIPILDRLKDDPEDYVYRSVANNLNDISKDHPELAIKLAKKWQGSSSSANWVVKHAMRTLLKKGHPEALSLFGYGDLKNIHLLDFKLSADVFKIGSNGQLQATLESTKSSKFRLEYVVHYVKANGKQSPKVFQLGEPIIDGRHEINRKINFEDLSTRKHFSGQHQIDFRINGKVINSLLFELI